MMATPYQMEIIQQPEHKRILMIFEGATHIWREIYMDGRKFPEGDELNPTYLGYSVGRWENPTRWSSRTRASTRTAGSITSAIRTPTRWKSSSGGRVRTGRRCTTRRRSPIQVRTRPFTMAWDIPWREAGELPEPSARRTTSISIVSWTILAIRSSVLVSSPDRRSRRREPARRVMMRATLLRAAIVALTLALSAGRAGPIRSSTERPVERAMGPGEQSKPSPAGPALGREGNHRHDQSWPRSSHDQERDLRLHRPVGMGRQADG